MLGSLTISASWEKQEQEQETVTHMVPILSLLSQPSHPP